MENPSFTCMLTQTVNCCVTVHAGNFFCSSRAPGGLLLNSLPFSLVASLSSRVEKKVQDDRYD